MSPLRKSDLSLFFLVLSLTSCTAEGPNADKGIESRLRKLTEKAVPVTAMTVTAREVPLVITRTGKTQAADRFEAKASSDMKIERIFVEEGGHVEAGDPLVKFDDEEGRLRLAMARAELREAEAALDLYNSQLQNRGRFIEEEGSGEQEVDLEKKIALAQATIERARIEVDLHEKTEDQTQINSPIAGTVTKRLATEGTTAAENQPVLEVVRVDPIRFVFTVPVDAVTALEKEAEISVTFPSLPGQEFAGEILRVGAEANAETNGVEVALNVPNSDLALKAEMAGNVVIRTQARTKIFPVAESALVKTEKSTYVYKIDGNKVRKVAVELGEPYNGQPTVEKGLVEGDRIVSSAEEGLQDGTIVEIL